MGTVRASDLSKEELDRQRAQSRSQAARQFVATAQGPASLLLTALALLAVSTVLLGASVGILEATAAAYLVLRGLPALEIRIKK